MKFILSEEKSVRNATKQGNKELAELEKVNNENESDRWHGVVPWLRLHHCVLEEDVLTSCKDVHKWTYREGIDSMNSTSRNNFFLKFVLTNVTTYLSHRFLMCILIFMMIF